MGGKIAFEILAQKDFPGDLGKEGEKKGGEPSP